jgi:CDP-diacylglycerol--glycerol-3-phosphate 3-phosphatidyltransferase
VWNLPNNLSLVRIFLIPVIVWLLARQDPASSLWAAVLFGGASATDMLDGYLARRSRQVTQVGKLLDPLADKLLVTACLIMLIPYGVVPAWAAFIIIGREMAVTGLRGAAVCQGYVIPAGLTGKYKTAFQMVACVLLILPVAILGPGVRTVGQLFLWVSLGLSLWSGLDYFVRFYKALSLDGNA